MQRTLHVIPLSLFAFYAAACAAPTADPEDGDPGLSAGPHDDGDVPPCGDDPALQPERCVDAQGALRCKVDTGFPGDELALCDLDPEVGMLIHFGPKDYSDPEEVAKYVLEAGGEAEFCLRVNTPNTTEKFFNSYNGRMRPNSHHWIVTMPPEHVPDDPEPWACGPQVLDRWLFGAQDPQIDVGVGADASLPDPGDPDWGLAHDIPANQTLLMDFHNVNVTQDPELREAWAALKYVDASEVLVLSDLIAFYNVGIAIPPRTRAATSRMRCDVHQDASGEPQAVYVNVMTGHAHQRMQRFSVWHERLDGVSDLVYESYDWAEPGNALYRDGVQNPPLPVPAGYAWGATSGYLQILPGEALSFECDFDNDLDQVVTMGETANDEMCNVFGNYFPSVGGMWNCFGR
jgi:hypothetical protein